ncbi:hypothetical protein F5Y13DRAFT_62474 [Hypoxylon sp. FL1857]|nr:hypothetical protein F5Y13DRAFT_62474 [Hypoxylon sp. FL1857]
MDRLVRRAAVRVPGAIRPRLSLPVTGTRHQPIRQASSLPSIAQTSFWKGLIPKPFRRPSEQPVDWGVQKKPKSKEWNPATFFILIFLFIGSMSIQMIALRRDFETFMRRSEVHIGLLREVVEKLQRGEEVDVEKTLGTGDAEKEKEWEEVLREIERDDILKNAKAEKAKQSAPPSGKAEAKSLAAPESTGKSTTKTGGSYSSFF